MTYSDDLLSPGYEAADEVRWVSEPAKRSGRTAFARDRARILHSSALRRLAAKTQIHTAGQSDFPRTRLTHTLEVSQIGRELGATLGADPDLVEVGCLAHDLGHPPFGHNGEMALNELAENFGGFEGNAQTLRVLTRLEAKSFTEDGRSIGLNLTRASLDAAIKYPWGRETNQNKFGFYADDEDIFNWARIGGIENRKSFEAQIMDWADDVAYSVHDVEDAIVANHLDLNFLKSKTDRTVIFELARLQYVDASDGEIDAAIERLLALPYWQLNFDQSHTSLARLKNLTSQLIGRFCSAAESATRKQFGDGLLTRYSAELIIPRENVIEVAVLKTLANLFVMQREGASEMQSSQRELLTSLGAVLLERDGLDLEPWLAPSWQAASSDAMKVRVVVDQIASLTDTSAVTWHKSLTHNRS
ncbi:MAG: deoxyguanosinetriphosphate triphosphohydrolase [Actinobacteria bacterium]|nr:deoxyguanosinetriphosphate triphosphohydrolase [Actinomycetota bacterium]